jgi:hypothetical protein
MLPFDSLVLASSSLFSSCIRAWKRHRSTQYHLIPQDCIVADYRRRHMRTISKCRVSCRTPALLWRRLVSLCRVCTCRSCSPNPSKVRNHQTSPFTTTFFTTSDLLYRNIQGAAYRASEMARSFVYVASAESACHARQAPDAESLCAPGHAMSVLAKCDNCLIDCSITVTYHYTRFVWRRR